MKERVRANGQGVPALVLLVVSRDTFEILFSAGPQSHINCLSDSTWRQRKLGQNLMTQRFGEKPLRLSMAHDAAEF